MQQYAECVAKEHSKTVQYRSTDRLLKHSDFVALCEKVISKEYTGVVEQYLCKEHAIVRGTTPQNQQVYSKEECDGSLYVYGSPQFQCLQLCIFQVVKFACGEDIKTFCLTETDIGILRFVWHLLTNTIDTL